MGVTMVDCFILIAHTLHVWGPLELQLFCSTLGYQEKAKETICSWNLMVECMHISCILLICCSMHTHRSLYSTIIGQLK